MNTDHDLRNIDSLKVAKFNKQDLVDICKIQKFVYPKEYQEPLSDLQVVYERRDLYGYCTKTMDGNVLVGYCIGFPIDPFDILPVIRDPWAGVGRPSHSKNYCPLFIYDCVVHPSHQGLSLGSKLVQEFLKESRNMGYSRIWAVAVDRMARSFWEKNGFVKVSDKSLIQNDSKFCDENLEWWNKVESDKVLPEIYSATGKIFES